MANSTAQFHFMPNSTRLYPHLASVNANLGPGDCSTEGGQGLFSTGGNACFEYGMLAHVTGNLDLENDMWEKLQDAIMTGDYLELEDCHSKPLPITAHWIMKDNKRPFSVDNLDWDLTHPSAYPYPRPKRRRRQRSSQKSSNSTESAVSKEVAGEVVVDVGKKVSEASETTADTTSASEGGDDNEDCVSISSSDACMIRALDGETFEGEYLVLSETSSSGSSSDESSLDKEVPPVSSSHNDPSGTSSPFDALRSSPATNMVADYMSSLSPPNESVNLTRSYAIPIGPSKKKSKKKPIMKFTPIREINGVNMANFLDTFAKDDPASREKIEIDDDAAPLDGQYIEMDLALGVLEEKHSKNEGIALQPESSDDSSEDSQESEKVDAMTRLTNLKGKGKDVKGKKAIIEEL